jgi:hypothetical protein
MRAAAVVVDEDVVYAVLVEVADPVDLVVLRCRRR